MDQESATIFQAMTADQKISIVAIEALDERLERAGWDLDSQFMFVLHRPIDEEGLASLGFAPAEGSGTFGYFSFPQDFADLGDDAVQSLEMLALVAQRRAAAGRPVLPGGIEDFYAVALVCEGWRCDAPDIPLEQIPDQPGAQEVRSIYLLDRHGWLTTSHHVRGQDGLEYRVPDSDGNFVDAGAEDVAIIRGLADMMLAAGTAHPEAGVDLDAVAKVGH